VLAGEVAVYGGRAGWLTADEAAARAEDVASANWHASAAWLARVRSNALFVDMGSTTTDLIPLRGGNIVARGYSDAERLAAGELAYAGAPARPVLSSWRWHSLCRSAAPGPR
jgi:uncharacterized hydantoinase/oxoprolinase family protein